jgi:hypothetical protein
MPASFRCPNCQQELLLGETRRAEATVCPRCFQVVTLPAEPVRETDGESFDFLEEALRPTSPEEPAASLTASPAAASQPQAILPPTSAPAVADTFAATKSGGQTPSPSSSPQPQIPAGRSVSRARPTVEVRARSAGQPQAGRESDAKQPAPVVATLIGCGVPALVLLLVLSWAVWYVVRYSTGESTTQEHVPPVTRAPLEKFFQEPVAERIVRELTELFEEYVDALGDLFDAGRAPAVRQRLGHILNKARQLEEHVGQIKVNQEEWVAANNKYAARVDEGKKRLDRILERIKRGEAKLPADSPDWAFILDCTDELGALLQRVASLNFQETPAERQAREFVEIYEQYAEALESLFDTERAKTAADQLRQVKRRLLQWEKHMESLHLDPREHKAAAKKYKGRGEQAVRRVLAASQRLNRGEAKLRPNSPEARSILQLVDEIVEILGRIATKYPF